MSAAALAGRPATRRAGGAAARYAKLGRLQHPHCPLRRRLAAGGGPSGQQPAATPALYLGAGFAAGGLGSVVGLGGGFVIVPILTGVAKFTQHQAHGTSLACVASTSVSGAATYWMDGEVNLAAAALMAAGASVTAGACGHMPPMRLIYVR